MWTEEHRRIYRRAGDGYPSDLRAAELGGAAAAFLQHREHTLPGRQAVDRAAGLDDLAGPAREGRNPQSGDWLPRSTRIRTN